MYHNTRSAAICTRARVAAVAAVARVVAVLQRVLMYWSQAVQCSTAQYSTVQYLVAEAVLLLARREAPVDAAPGALAPLQAHRAAELRGRLSYLGLRSQELPARCSSGAGPSSQCT